jgi:glutamyl-tRNA(Gln) amidotransferase subunit E
LIPLKCGLEIHQRLEGGKLFCRCPSDATGEKPLFEISRQQHIVVSELGEKDRTAAFEGARNRNFKYQVFDNNCEVETDEEPPHGLNASALDASLTISILLGSKPVDELQVMRKTVIDGSNTGGFQRTAIVATGGKISSSGGEVGIQTVCIEEESAGIVEEKGGEATFRLDRLGIPLVEIATAPDIRSPEQAREVAEAIGTLLRHTGKVARGIGTIRQDLNISIDGGARCELKGAQDLAMLATTVQMEVERQQKLLEIKPKIAVLAPKQKLKSADLTKIFAGTSSKLFRKGLDAGSKIIGFALIGYAGILGFKLGENRRFGSEVSDYAKRAGVGGIIHSDEDLSKYPISEKESADIRKALGAGSGDAFVMVMADDMRANDAVKLAFNRAIISIVPEETRKVLPDGASAFMRPLPGGARMYPETDVQPVRITSEKLEAIRKNLPKKPEEKKAALLSMLNAELAGKMMRSHHLQIFERLVERGADPVLAATTLEETLVSLRRAGVNVEKITEEKLTELFSEYSKGTFVKAAINDILAKLAEDSKASVNSIVKASGLSKLTGAELKKAAEAEGNDLKKIMAKYRLRVDAKELSGLISKRH